jgi:hypothetical protein
MAGPLTSSILLVPMLAFLTLPAVAAGGDAAGTAPVVMLASRADGAAADAAAREVASQLADLPVRLEVRWVEAPTGDLREQIELARRTAALRAAAAVFWVELASPGRLYLFVADVEGGRLLVRETGSGGDSAEGRLMTIGVIVRSAVRGVLAGDTAAGEPVPVPPAPPMPKKDGELLEFGLAYGLHLFSNEVVLLHGVRIEGSIRLAGPLRLLAAFRAHLPPRVEHDGLIVGVLLYPAELGLAARFPFGPWSVEVGASALVTVVDLDITSADRELVLSDDARRVEFAVNPWIGARLGLGPVAAVFLRLSTDVVVNRHRYVVDQGDRVEAVVHPWRFRPLILLGASFSAL